MTPGLLDAQIITTHPDLSIEDYDYLVEASQRTSRSQFLQTDSLNRTVFYTPYIVSYAGLRDTVTVHRNSGYVWLPPVGTFGFVSVRRDEQTLVSESVNLAPTRLQLQSLEAGAYEVVLAGCSFYKIVLITVVD